MAVADVTRLWRTFCPLNSYRNSRIRILQWNILADALAVSTNNSTGLQETSFVKAPIQCLHWSYRLPLILKEINECEPDIICLQEVDRFEDVRVNGYDGMFLPKVDSPCCRFTPNNGPDGCAILYNTATVSVMDRRDIILLNESGQPTNQVAILAKFSFRGNNSVCVGTTHLKAKGGFEALRFAQGMNLLEEMKKFAKGDPFMICGDFNAVPSEAVCHAYRSLEGGPVLKSAYSEYSQTGQDPLFTTMKYREAGLSKYTGDYIWYDSSQLRVGILQNLLTESAIGDKGLPNSIYPSDHMALCAEMIIL